MQSSWVRSVVYATILASVTVEAINLDVTNSGMSKYGLRKIQR